MNCNLKFITFLIFIDFSSLFINFSELISIFMDFSF